MTYSQHFEELGEHVYSVVLLKQDLQYFMTMPLEKQAQLFSKTPGLRRIINLITRNLIIGVGICFNKRENYSFAEVGNSILIGAPLDDAGKTVVRQVLVKANEFAEDPVFKDHIKVLRDKHFAHIDLDRHKHQANVLYQEIIDAIVLIQELYKALFEVLNQSPLLYTSLETSAQQYVFQAIESCHRVWNLVEAANEASQEYIPLWDVIGALTGSASQKP